MKQKIKNWWYWNSEFVLFPLAIVVLIVSIFSGMLLIQANAYKYNCNLDHRPDLYTTAFIADSTYAYNPTLFCNTLKEKMHK